MDPTPKEAATGGELPQAGVRLVGNAHKIEAVFSTRCEGTVCAGGNNPLPCRPCRGLFKLHPFQVVIRHPIPVDKNVKFTLKADYCSHREIYQRYNGVHGVQ